MAPAAGATGVAVGANVAAVFAEAMDPATLTASTFTLVPQGGSTPVAATVTYDAAARKAVLDPNADLAAGQAYTATVTTGATDPAGNALAADEVWSLTTAPPPDTAAQVTAIEAAPADPTNRTTASFA